MINRDTLGQIESREGSDKQGEALDVRTKPTPKIRYEKEKSHGKETERFNSN